MDSLCVSPQHKPSNYITKTSRQNYNLIIEKILFLEAFYSTKHSNAVNEHVDFLFDYHNLKNLKLV